MIEKSKAYEILGLKEDAGRDEIIKRYDILLKKYKHNQHEQKYSFKEVSEAYNLLMGYNHMDFVQHQDENKKKPNVIYKLLNVDEKKVNNFFHYHKMHIIAVILAIAIVVYFVASIVGNTPSDLNMVFLGNIYSDRQNEIKQELIKQLPDLNEASVQFIVLSENISGKQQYAMQMKTVTLMQAGELDVIISDRENFFKYAEIGAFENLDPLINELGINLNENSEYVLKVKDGSNGNQTLDSHLYGVDVKNSSFLNSFEIEGDEMIASIRSNAKHYENAFKALKVIID